MQNIENLAQTQYTAQCTAVGSQQGANLRKNQQQYNYYIKMGTRNEKYLVFFVKVLESSCI